MKKSTRKMQSPKLQIANKYWAAFGGVTPSASQSGGGIAAAVDDWARAVDRGHARPNVTTVRRTTADDVRQIGGSDVPILATAQPGATRQLGDLNFSVGSA